MVLRVLSGAMGIVFLFGAAVQWNDPDPLRWMAAYLAGAVLSFQAALGGLRVVPTALVFAGLGIWLAIWLPALRHASLDAIGSFGMSGAAEEEDLREALGLLLLVAWTGLLLWVALRRARLLPGAPH